MGVTFTHPWLLLGLALVPWFIHRHRTAFSDLSLTRQRLALVVRLAGVIGLVLALAGMQTTRRSTALCTLFILDGSDSISPAQREQGLEYIKTAVREMRRDDLAGIIVVAGEAFVDQAPVTEFQLQGLQTVTDASRTNLARGVRLALGAFPQGARKRIVLLSDGNETQDSLLDEARLAAGEQVRIDTVSLSRAEAPEVLVDHLVLPPRAKRGEPFEARLAIRSTIDTPATIKLYRNGAYVGQRKVHLSSGSNAFSFRQQLTQPGFFSYQAVVDPGQDTVTINNRGIGFTHVRGQPRVLIVDTEVDQLDHLVRALRREHVDVDLKPPTGIPTTLPELQNYDALVLSDVGAIVLSTRQMKMIRSAVRDLGIGFAMLGGEDSFGVGGYFKTPIEETLPVYMDPTGRRIMPSMAMVIAVDTSGSMSALQGGVEKIQLANEAACRTVELLKSYDQLCVIGVDTAAKTVLPMTKATDKLAMQNRIRTMRGGGGGINVHTALEAAHKALQQTEARIKHIILMADANDCDQQSGCVSLAEQMKAEKITLTAVGLGTEADVHAGFLQDLAKAGGGNFYVTSDVQRLAQIYTKDTMLMARSLLVEEPFRPTLTGSDPVVGGLPWGSAPPLLGYVGTSPKPRASVPLVTHKAQPLLAHWQFGLGKSIAFTSDAKPRWAAHWIAWPAWDAFWAQALRWIVRGERSADYQTDVEIVDDHGVITVDAIDDSGNFVNFLSASATVIAPNADTFTAPLRQTAPGRYQGSFPAPQPGAYMVRVTAKAPGGESRHDVTGVALPYPAEYARLQPDTALLSQVAEATGGRFAIPPADVFGGARKSVRLTRDVWRLLMLGVLLLFPLDVALRRVVLDQRQLQALWARLRLRRPRLEPAPTPGASAAATMERLTSAKQSVRARTAPQPVVPSRAAPQPTPRPAPPEESEPPPPEPPAEEIDAARETMQRLLEAKRRARK